jgi:dihydropteroate synthase
VIPLERPLVMGIVNLSADSFSGDGRPDLAAALEHARALVGEGADLIDVGAESARANRGPVDADIEAGRLVDFIRDWDLPVPLSVNTWRPEVAARALAAGGDLLNDIGALPDDRNARVCAETGAALLIMHSVGAPKVPHTHVTYDDVLGRMGQFFEEKLALAARAGLPEEATVLDPGIDFAKQRDDNLRVYRGLERLQRFGRPILLPVSRKTVIGDVLGLPDPRDRDAGTIACVVAGYLRGAHLFRVHRVGAVVRALRVLEALGRGG